MNFTTLGASERFYLDHNATTPPALFLRDQVGEWLEAWGNPSSIHYDGRRPKTLLREARANVSRAIGCDPLEIIFTSGGSESNNLAIKGVTASVSARERGRVVVSSVEHPSVKRSVEALLRQRFQVEFVPVDRGGFVDMDKLRSAIDENTVLVSVMLANNETGNIFPIREITALAHAKGALMHTDAVQALGKMPVNVRELGVDLASFSGHKFYSLKGAGVLYTRRGLVLESLLHGGGQERHRRGGTENALAIAALGAMCARESEVLARAERMRIQRDFFESEVLKRISGVSVTGQLAPRLPNTSSLIIPGVDGETLLMNLDMRGFSVSTGAACSSGNPEPSPVLLAMGLSRDEAQSSLRVGLGWGTTDEGLARFVSTLVEVVEHIRGFKHL